MAIFRCSKCGHIREVGKDYIGKNVKCPKCESPSTIHDTVAFLKALISKYIEQSKELNQLREDSNIEHIESGEYGNILLEDVDIHNTDLLTQRNNLVPIKGWFEKRNIQVLLTPEAVDTTGFFDEIASLIGEKFDVLNYVTSQIKYIQNKGYTNVKIDLSKKNQKEIQQITSFCKTLYDYSFVAKYFYQKKDKIIRLTLQTAPKIREFFNGIWMEWYALIEVLDFFSSKDLMFTCSRNLNITFSGNKSYELDLFFLTEKGFPICIECKTGEFRHDIDKYLTLRKLLKIDKSQFVICVFGLSQEQARGMSSMYDLTFVNENGLTDYMQSIV